MPITFLDNYPLHALEENFINREGNILYGELWVYQQLILLQDKIEGTWLVKHSYPLSQHPHSVKQEGEIDFLIISPKGVVVIEVKGGGVDYIDGHWYYTQSGVPTKEFPDPFVQVKENMFSLRDLVNLSDVYYYRAVIFPHENNVECNGPNLSGYKDILYTARDHANCNNDSERMAMRFLKFLEDLPKRSRMKQVESFAPGRSKESYSKMIWEYYPEINKTQIDRVKRSLFQDFKSYGFDIERLNSILYDQNYEILQGLNRNKHIMIEGPPGSGKTVIAKKFIIQERKRDQRGIYVCANLLLAAYMRWLLYEDYKIDRQFLDVCTYSKFLEMVNEERQHDYVIIDEAQEFFDRGLEDALKRIEHKSSNPKLLVLYDLDQAYGNNNKDLSFFQDFIMREGRFSHYEFHKVHRCSQCKDIREMSEWIGDVKNKDWTDVHKRFERVFKINLDNNKALQEYMNSVVEQLLKLSSSELKNVIILIEFKIFNIVTSLLKEFFPRKFEELSEDNISNPPTRLRYTTPIKFKGMESETVFLFTSSDLSSGSTRTEAYVGATRAIYQLNIIIWRKP